MPCTHAHADCMDATPMVHKRRCRLGSQGTCSGLRPMLDAAHAALHAPHSVHAGACDDARGWGHDTVWLRQANLKSRVPGATTMLKRSGGQMHDGLALVCTAAWVCWQVHSRHGKSLHGRGWHERSACWCS
eukprot:363891-Chlamydomonas_euryale.AAC.11